MRLSSVGLQAARRICTRAALRSLTLWVALVTGCGDFGGPRSGTESGNPINPPAPPAQTEIGTDPVPTGDPTVPMVDQPTPNVMPTAPETDSTRPGPLPVPTEDWPVWPTGDQGTQVPQPKPTAGEEDDAEDTEPTPTMVEPLPSVTTPLPSTGGPTTAPMQDPSMVPAPSAGDGTTQPGNSGAAGMCSVDACLAQANTAAMQLGQPRSEPAAFDNAVCDEAMTCTCSGATATETLTLDAAACIATGRFGECLFESSEYSGCSVAGDECAQACSLLWSRTRDEAVSAPSVSVRVSTCAADGQCRFVLESDLGCVTGPGLVPSDCTDAEAALTGP